MKERFTFTVWTVELQCWLRTACSNGSKDGPGRQVRREINAYLEESIARRRIYFGIYNLKYAGKSGRIPSAAAFIGDKIGY